MVVCCGQGNLKTRGKEHGTSFWIVMFFPSSFKISLSTSHNHSRVPILLLLLFLQAIPSEAFNHTDFEWCKYEIHIEAVPWATAKAICEQSNKTLAHIENRPEHSYLSSLLANSIEVLKTDTQQIGQYLWIGLHVNDNGSSNWLDCNPYVALSTYNPAPARMKGCFMLDRYNEPTKFSAIPCIYPRMFICEASKIEMETCFTTGIPSEIKYKPYQELSGASYDCTSLCSDACYAYRFEENNCFLYTQANFSIDSENEEIVHEKRLLQSLDEVTVDNPIDPLSVCLQTSTIELSAPEYEIQTPSLPFTTTSINTSPTPDASAPYLQYMIYQEKIPITSQFRIDLVCHNCLNPEFIWTVQQGDNDPTVNKVIFKDIENFPHATDEPNLVIQPGIIYPAKRYRFRVNVTAGYFKLSRVFNLVGNLPPYGGSCEINPTKGILGETTFTLTCVDWRDENGRDLRSQQDTDSGIVYSVIPLEEVDLSSTDVILNKESTPLSFTIDINVDMLMIKITDAFGDFASVNLSITLTDGRDELTSNTSDYINFASQSNDITQVLDAGKSLTTEWNNLHIKNTTNYVVKLLPKKWPSGLLDAGNTCNESYTYEQLVENVLQKPKDTVKDAAVKALDSIAIAMLNGLQRLGTNNFTDIEQAANSFVFSDSRKASDTSVIKLVEAHSLLAERFINLTSQLQERSETVLKNNAVKAMVQFTSILVNLIVPDDLSNMYEAVKTQSTKDSRQYVDFMAFVNRKDAYDLMDCAKITPEERTGINKLQSKIYRMVFKQKQVLAEQTVVQLMTTLQKIMQDISESTCSGCNETFSSDWVDTMVMKNNASLIDNKKIRLADKEIRMSLDDKSKQDVTVSIATFKRNPLMLGGTTTSAILTSDVVKIRVTDMSNSKVKVRFISITLPITSEISGTFTPQFTPEDASECIYHSMVYRSKNDELCIKLQPLERTLIMAYEVYVRYGKYPTHLRYDISSDISPENIWTTCVTPRFDVGVVYVCLRPVLSSGKRISKRSVVNTESGTTDPKLTPYNMTVATTSCQMWDQEKQMWKADHEKCKMEWLASENKLTCTCYGISEELILGNSFYVPANTISFSNIFLKFSPQNQAAVLGVLTTIIVLYIVACTWARYQDKKDLVKWGVTALINNQMDDTYFYLITVYTGVRFGAGTKSKVDFMVIGSERDTGVRSLFDGVRKEFERGSVMHFIMTTGHPLGNLDYIQLWLSQSEYGIDPWYLHRIDVEDLQQSYRYVFLCNKWLADSSTTDCLETVIFVCGKEDVLAFQNLFYHSIFENLANNHMFISIVYRPTSSNYTRVQRVTSFLVFIVMTMIANAIYFTPADEFEDPEQFKLGPLIPSLQTIYVSIVSSAISVSTLFLVVFLFRKSKPRCAEHSTKTSSLKYMLPGIENIDTESEKQSRELERLLISKGMIHTDGKILPYWGVYLAWMLSISGSFTAIFFLLLYSMEWGKQKTEMWLTQFFLSFSGTSLILDQLKILVMAAAFALLFVPTNLFRPSPLRRLTVLRNYRQKCRPDNSEMSDHKSELNISEETHRKILMENKSRQMAVGSIKENVITILCICVVAILCYGNRDDKSFHIHNNVNNYLVPLNSLYSKQSMRVKDYAEWLNKVVFKAVYPETDEDGKALSWRWKQYFSDFSNYRVGPPRLRQIRVRESSQQYPYIGRTRVYPRYHAESEETGDYCLGWTNQPCDLIQEAYSYSSDVWKYTKASDIWGMPIAGISNTYGGGGYIAEMDVNRDMTEKILKELVENRWFDRNTRAVFFEFTLYSADTNIFTYAIFLAEFIETGGVISTYIIYPFRIYQHYGKIGIMMLITEILFVILAFILLIKVCVGIIKERKAYFKSDACKLDFIIVLACIATTAMYIVRFVFAINTMKKFKDNPKDFLNFQHIVSVDFVFVVLLSVLQFLFTLRLIRTLEVFKNVKKLILVLNQCMKDLRWFGIVFWYFLLGFAFVGKLMFGKDLKRYTSILDSLNTLTISILGKSNFKQLEDMDPVMSKLFFAVFVLIQVYLLLTVFLIIICESIDKISQKSNQSLDIVTALADLFNRSFKRNIRHHVTETDKQETYMSLFKDLCDCCHTEMIKIKRKSKRKKTITFAALDKVIVE